jgi:hypothetical protein
MTLGIRLVKEHDGRFAARIDTHPRLVGRGATEEAARRDLEERLPAADEAETSYDGSDYEDWDPRPLEFRKDDD